MTSVLERIHEYKRDEVACLARRYSRSALEDRAQAATPPREFAAALGRAARNGYGLIAEIKKASPSRGLIRPDFQPGDLARGYARGGATCLSVLTDAPSFQGSADHLQMAARTTNLPILRKDFMIDPLQCLEARAMGADCILIIMALVSDDQARDLEDRAMDLGMAVLVEVHNRIELDRAMTLRSRLLGINNRNLMTFAVSRNVTAELAGQVGDEYQVISESGFFTSGDLAEVARQGVRCFLIGESLMRQDDVEQATRALLENPVPA